MAVSAEVRKNTIKAVDGALRRELRGANRRKQRSTEFSCCAVNSRIDRMFGWSLTADRVIGDFDQSCRRMGLRTLAVDQFDEFPRGKQRQQARAIWLEWVKLMMEEGVV